MKKRKNAAKNLQDITPVPGSALAQLLAYHAPKTKQVDPPQRLDDMHWSDAVKLPKVTKDQALEMLKQMKKEGNTPASADMLASRFNLHTDQLSTTLSYLAKKQLIRCAGTIPSRKRIGKLVRVFEILEE